MKCCFCGKEEEYGNDIRPLVNNRGNRCCNQCNLEIVIPNRLKFWKGRTVYMLKNKDTNEFILQSGLDESKSRRSLEDPYLMFNTIQEAEHHASIDYLVNYEIVPVNLREDI